MVRWYYKSGVLAAGIPVSRQLKLDQFGPGIADPEVGARYAVELCPRSNSMVSINESTLVEACGRPGSLRVSGTGLAPADTG